MKRKEFLKKSILAGIAGAMAPQVFHASDSSAQNVPVGFNHLPNKEIKTMNTILHKSETRGSANHGWLLSRHSFSFASYYNPDRMNFGALRVLNDDKVAAGRGFGTHGHDNMEIISIPLEGDLEHQDSMGNKGIITQGEIQVMSAGSGITHSEYNRNSDLEVKFLQIWVTPKQRQVTPRYDQIKLNATDRVNSLQQILSPNPNDAGVWIHQDAWFYLSKLDASKEVHYKLHDASKNGVYAFVLTGEVNINGQSLNKRDGFGIWDVDELIIEGTTQTEVLLMEVPMG